MCFGNGEIFASSLSLIKKKKKKKKADDEEEVTSGSLQV